MMDRRILPPILTDEEKERFGYYKQKFEAEGVAVMDSFLNPGNDWGKATTQEPMTKEKLLKIMTDLQESRPSFPMLDQMIAAGVKIENIRMMVGSRWKDKFQGVLWTKHGNLHVIVNNYVPHNMFYLVDVSTMNPNPFEWRGL